MLMMVMMLTMNKSSSYSVKRTSGLRCLFMSFFVAEISRLSLWLKSRCGCRSFMNADKGVIPHWTCLHVGPSWLRLPTPELKNTCAVWVYIWGFCVFLHMQRVVDLIVPHQKAACTRARKIKAGIFWLKKKGEAEVSKGERSKSTIVWWGHF